MHDIVIRGGTVIDGTGSAPVSKDIAIRNGLIVDIGKVDGTARRVIDAEGSIVTPGFVDFHTHLDGQATWDPLLSPSFENGVTTLIMGNCGVGFAPVRADQRDYIIRLMDGVEEIPGAALHEGIRWSWETFPEYLAALEAMPRSLDIGTMMTHGPLRTFVMDERAERDERATDADIARMQMIVREGMAAGAFGFSTSRTPLHRAAGGGPVPGTSAEEKELMAIARAVSDSGHGMFQVVPHGAGGEISEDAYLDEIRMLRRIARRTGCPVQFILSQYNSKPEIWRSVLKEAEAAHAEGAQLTPMVFGRAVGALFSFNSTNPFSRYPSYLALDALSPDERKRALRDPEVRARILADGDPLPDGWTEAMNVCWPSTYANNGSVSYEPTADWSIESIAAKKGRPPREVAYDLMLDNDCSAFLIFNIYGYSHGNLEAVREMMLHPLTVLGGSDAGAHVRTICDGALPTFMLTHWARDRTVGPKLPVEWVVRQQSHDTARAIGLYDRGVLAPGYIADVNIIDWANLRSHSPEVVHDLPANAPRLLQRSEGFIATLKHGQVISERGEDTGARPGQLLRSQPRDFAATGT